MNNRTWLFAVITSALLMGFYAVAETIGLPSVGFAALSLGLLSVTAFQAINTKLKKSSHPNFLPHRVKHNA